jgi:hypothetical protein
LAERWMNHSVNWKNFLSPTSGLTRKRSIGAITSISEKRSETIRFPLPMGLSTTFATTKSWSGPINGCARHGLTCAMNFQRNWPPHHCWNRLWGRHVSEGYWYAQCGPHGPVHFSYSATGNKRGAISARPQTALPPIQSSNAFSLRSSDCTRRLPCGCAARRRPI